MQSSALPTTPDLLSKEMVAAARTKSAIFLFPKSASRTRLAPFYAANNSRLQHFNNNEELAAESRRIRYLSGRTPFRRATSAVSTIFSGIALSAGEFSVELTLASNQSRFGVRDAAAGQIVRMDENELTASTLAKFLDAYSTLPTDQRPLFVIETHDVGSKIDRRLSQISENIEFLWYREHAGLQQVMLERLPSQSMAQLVDQYAENSFSPIARLDGEGLNEAIEADEPLSRSLAARLFHLRAVASQRGKFETIAAARALADLLEENREVLDTPEAPVLLSTKVFANLWLLYCREEGRDLFDNSMAIARALEDELMQAHCARLINTVEPHGSFTDQFSRLAAKTFFDRGMFDFANYCINNALVGRFYTDEPVAREFTEVIETSAENLDGFQGLAIMMNNAGVAHLIEGDPVGAIAWFERASQQPRWPLHRFGIDVNLMFAHFLEGANPDPQDLLKTARAIVRQVDGRYRHQIAHLLLNLSLLAQPYRDCADELNQIIKQLQILDDPVVIRDRTTLARLASRLGLADLPVETHPGRRGEFIEKHGFVPGFHHTWL
jgi:hypothetical protein